MNPFNRNAALWIVIVLLLALLYSVFQGGTTRTAGNTISYSDFVRAVEQRQVQDVRISRQHHHRHLPRAAQRRAEVRDLCAAARRRTSS